MQQKLKLTNGKVTAEHVDQLAGGRFTSRSTYRTLAFELKRFREKILPDSIGDGFAKMDKKARRMQPDYADELAQRLGTTSLGEYPFKSEARAFAERDLPPSEPDFVKEADRP